MMIHQPPTLHMILFQQISPLEAANMGAILWTDRPKWDLSLLGWIRSVKIRFAKD